MTVLSFRKAEKLTTGRANLQKMLAKSGLRLLAKVITSEIPALMIVLVLQL